MADIACHSVLFYVVGLQRRHELNIVRSFYGVFEPSFRNFVFYIAPDLMTLRDVETRSYGGVTVFVTVFVTVMVWTALC